MSSKAIKNVNKTKSKKKLDTMGSSISSKDKAITGEASLLTHKQNVEEKTGGELIMSMLKNAKKSVKKVVRSMSPAPTKKEDETPSLYSQGVLPGGYGVSMTPIEQEQEQNIEYLKYAAAGSSKQWGDDNLIDCAVTEGDKSKVTSKDPATVMPSFNDVMEELGDIKSFNRDSREMIMTSIEELSKRQMKFLEDGVANVVSKVEEELLNKLSEMQAFNALNANSQLSKLDEVTKLISDNKQLTKVEIDESDNEECVKTTEAVEYTNKLLSCDDAILSKSWGTILQYASELDALSQAQLIEKISAGNDDLVSAICRNCDDGLNDKSDESVEDKNDSNEDLSFEEKKAIFETKPLTTEVLNENKMKKIFKECSALIGKDWSYDGHLDHLTVGDLKIHIKVNECIGTPYVFTAKNSAPKKKVSFFSVLESDEYTECQYQSSPENHDVLSYISRVFTRYIEEFNRTNVATV